MRWLLILALTLPLWSDSPALLPLDLPSGATARADEEEDAPESIIFYGQEYEADAFFWCCDKSGSMSGGPIATLHSELAQAINSLSRRAEFGIVFFANSSVKYQPMPVKARPAQRANAVEWVYSQAPGGTTCLGDGGVATLEIANQSRKRNARIIAMADGGANCPGCTTEIQQITTANWKRLPIDTLFIGNDATGAACMQQLAQANGGSFSHVTP